MYARICSGHFDAQSSLNDLVCLMHAIRVGHITPDNLHIDVTSPAQRVESNHTSTFERLKYYYDSAVTQQDDTLANETNMCTQSCAYDFCTRS